MKKTETKSDQKWYEKASGKRAHARKNIEKHAAAQEKRLLKKQEKESEASGKALKKGKAGSDAKADAASFGKGAPLRERKPSAKMAKRPAGLPLFAREIPQDERDILNHFDSIIASVHSLSGKQQVQLAQDIRILSHKLTDERSNRRVGYMNESSSVSAYLSYFLWWNLVRLVPLFSALPDSAFSLDDGSVALDIGSGPLTVPIALWLSKPSLRSKKVTWYTMDLSQSALAAGEELFLAIAARTLKAGGATPGAGTIPGAADASPWKIVRVRGELGSAIKQKAQLITAANVFNEVVQNQDMPPDYLAKKYTNELLAYADSSAEKKDQSILLVEPGDPKSARFVSLMRDALMRRDFTPLAPCPHTAACPMEGKKGGKWCNFAFTTENAPAALLKLSEKAGLPKERAVLSFVLSKRSAALNSSQSQGATTAPDSIQGPNPKAGSPTLPLRITSDFIKLPELHRSGYYACSELGLVLAIDDHRVQPENGELLFVPYPKDAENLPKDKKSGALLLRL